MPFLKNVSYSPVFYMNCVHFISGQLNTCRKYGDLVCSHLIIAQAINESLHFKGVQAESLLCLLFLLTTV